MADPVPAAAPAPEIEELCAPGWSVIIPVKPTALGKSRLQVPGVDRVRLARAIALDTMAAAAGASCVSRVIVVTDDGGLVLQASDIPGLRFVAETDPDLREGAGPRGLNPAVARGAHAAGDGPRAALLGDLPSLRPHDLDHALQLASAVPRGVVADAEGTGSTLVTANAGVACETAFGPESLAAHVALGCVPLDVPAASTLRRDVDTAAHIESAAVMGLGPRTAALLGSPTA